MHSSGKILYMLNVWKDISFLLRKLTISPMRKRSILRLSPEEQSKQVSTLLSRITPVLVQLHTLQHTDTEQLSIPIEIVVQDYKIERKRFERIDTQEYLCAPQTVLRSYSEWLYDGDVNLFSLLNSVIYKFQREYSDEPEDIYVAEECEEESKKILVGTHYHVFGRRHMPKRSVVAEKKRSKEIA